MSIASSESAKPLTSLRQQSNDTAFSIRLTVSVSVLQDRSPACDTRTFYSQ